MDCSKDISLPGVVRLLWVRSKVLGSFLGTYGGRRTSIDHTPLQGKRVCLLVYISVERCSRVGHYSSYSIVSRSTANKLISHSWSLELFHHSSVLIVPVSVYLVFDCWGSFGTFSLSFHQKNTKSFLYAEETENDESISNLRGRSFLLTLRHRNFLRYLHLLLGSGIGGVRSAQRKTHRITLFAHTVQLSFLCAFEPYVVITARSKCLAMFWRCEVPTVARVNLFRFPRICHLNVGDFEFCKLKGFG